MHLRIHERSLSHFDHYVLGFVLIKRLMVYLIRDGNKFKSNTMILTRHSFSYLSVHLIRLPTVPGGTKCTLLHIKFCFNWRQNIYVIYLDDSMAKWTWLRTHISNVNNSKVGIRWRDRERERANRRATPIFAYRHSQSHSFILCLTVCDTKPTRNIN